jgi:hypothetical protein
LAAEAKAGIYRIDCHDQWKPKCEGFGHVYMTRDMEKNPYYEWGLIRCYPDVSMIDLSQSDPLIEVNGKRDFKPIDMGADKVYRWLQNEQSHWSWGVWLRYKEKTWF